MAEVQPVRQTVSDETMDKFKRAVVALPLSRLYELKAYLDGAIKVAEKRR